MAYKRKETQDFEVAGKNEIAGKNTQDLSPRYDPRRSVGWM